MKLGEFPIGALVNFGGENNPLVITSKYNTAWEHSDNIVALFSIINSRICYDYADTEGYELWEDDNAY